jgi:hypothetical protein
MVGWVILLTLVVLVILLVLTVINWAAPRPQEVNLPPVNRPTRTSVIPTSTPRPTATPLLTVTATPTSTANYPAYWREGMWLDANAQWWPADDVRAEVVAMIEQHYLEIDEALWSLTHEEMFEKISDEEAARYLTGEHLKYYISARHRYREIGAPGVINEEYVQATERDLTVRDFSYDGLSCNVEDLFRVAYLMRYDPDTDSWNRLEIPEDGLLDGTKYLGTAIYRMEYDPEDGRWKQSKLVNWLPRPFDTERQP